MGPVRVSVLESDISQRLYANPKTHGEKIFGGKQHYSFTLEYVGTHEAPSNNYNLENYKANSIDTSIL